MAFWRFRRGEDGSRCVPRGSVLAQGNADPEYPSHIGISLEELWPTRRKVRAQVCDVDLRDDPYLASEMLAEGAAWINGPARDHEERIRHALQELDTMAARGVLLGYRVHPPIVVGGPGSESRTSNYYEFSCAGFVAFVYARAGYPLIDLTQLDDLPKIGTKEIITIYGREMARYLSELAPSIGLGPPGTWPILLCGYILHSLARSQPEIQQGPLEPRNCASAKYPVDSK